MTYPTWWFDKEKPWSPEDRPFVYPDWWVFTGDFWELKGDSTYCVTWPLKAKSVVVEVGSYRGVWLSWMLPRYNCHYWCIEPSPYSFKALEKVAAGHPKVHLCNFALWSEDEKGTLCDIERDGANLFGGQGPTAEVELVDAVRFFRENKIRKVDLLSVNIEGAEFILLPYLIRKGLIKRVKNLMIQWHAEAREWKAELQVWKIRETLVPTHKMAWNLGAWECWTRKGSNG